MGRFFRPAMALALALFTHPDPMRGPLASIAAPAPSAPPRPTTTTCDLNWYEPDADDFRPPYESDVTLGGRQTWEQYWSWVQSFYTGNLWSRGWNDSGRWLLKELRSDDQRDRLRTQLNRLGRDICAEWAKDYTIRKIGTADLVAWGKMMQKARSLDDGSGTSIGASLDTIGAQYRLRMERRAPAEPSETSNR